MAITFDQANHSHIQQLIDLRLAYLADDFGALPASQEASLPQELVPYLALHLGRDLHVHAAFEDGMIVACAWILFVDKPPSPRFPHGRTGVLFNVYTTPGRRHQGLASAVMRHLLAEARAMELDVVELHATDDGYPLYLSLGFEDDSSTHKAMRLELS